jgi:small subunit ribosomal protein S16
MAVKIRLKRLGSKKNAHYRLVAADARSPRDGKVIEELGYYDPNVNPSEVKIKIEAAKKWLATGATPTDSAKTLLKKAGVID